MFIWISCMQRLMPQVYFATFRIWRLPMYLRRSEIKSQSFFYPTFLTENEGLESLVLTLSLWMNRGELGLSLFVYTYCTWQYIHFFLSEKWLTWQFTSIGLVGWGTGVKSWIQNPFCSVFCWTGLPGLPCGIIVLPTLQHSHSLRLPPDQLSVHVGHTSLRLLAGKAERVS